MNFSSMLVKDVLNHFKVTPEGLNEESAKESQRLHGLNKLDEVKSDSIFKVFLSQFKDFLVLILLVAALTSAAIGKWESTLVIVTVLILNALLGTIQHVKAEQSLNSLKALSSPLARVMRNGIKQEIASEQIVIGDIIVLEAGDFIAADARLIECNSLQTNESALTGESLSVDKQVDALSAETTALGDRINCVYSSSYVTYGRALAVVTHIGQGTEIGKIASLISSAKEKSTPLQQDLDRFGKKLALAIMAISAVIFALGVYRNQPILDALMFAISLAVAAIPEALSSIVTIVLALGTRKMANENAIIRKLHAVESLGSISVICSDKTGTLTQNKMTIQYAYVDHKLVPSAEISSETAEKNPQLTELILAGLLCSDAVTTEGQKLGDPTEIALVDLGELIQLDELDMRRAYPRISELPFDSGRKLMSTHNRVKGQDIAFTKGALDVLLQRTISIETSMGVRPITEADRLEYERINFELSNGGLRILAFAKKDMTSGTLELHHENDLILLGLVAMMDPPREDSREAVLACKSAGIKPVMITGDHKITATAIAREIGILEPGDMVLDGDAVEQLSDQELFETVPTVSVYARVSPEHKIRIVNAWQTRGNIVAMTGDGVNDAPALKKADVGIAMGITGTEVSKDASSMVLTDDRFSTIVKAISNGRSIYGNIKNAIRFLLSGNTAGILAVVYAALTGLAAPFAPVHLLFINLLTDSLPAIAIGLEPPHGDLMKQKPRNVNSPIIDRYFAFEILFQGLIIAAATLIAYLYGLKNDGHAIAMTMAFATLSLSRLIHGLNCRMDSPLTYKTLFSNPYSYFALLLGATLLFAVLLIKPLHHIFEIAPLTSNHIQLIMLLSFAPLIVIQLQKQLTKFFSQRSKT